MEEVKYSILHEDDHILVMSKEHGFACQSKDGESLETVFPNYHLITRLDQPAAGLVLMAKHPSMAARLTTMLRKKELNKQYLCLVEGHLIPTSGEATDFLYKKGQKTVYDAVKGDKSTMTYNVVKNLDNYDFVECDITTGRFHQIRFQLGKLGNPIKGDLKYGARRSNKEGGIYLCCYKLSFIHPDTKTPLVFEQKVSEFSLPLWAQL